MSQNTVVEHDVPCISCSYNLRSLAVDGLCPECGDSVDHTLKLMSRFESRDQLFRLRRAVRWLGWIPCLCLVIGIVLSLLPVRGSSGVQSLLFLPLIALGFVYFAVFVSFVKDTDDLTRDNRRPLMKSLSIGGILLGAMLVTEMLSSHAYYGPVIIIGGLIYTGFALLLRRLISIYDRIGLEEPSRNCLVVIWCLNSFLASVLLLRYGGYFFLKVPYHSHAIKDWYYFVIYSVAIPFLPLVAIAGYLVLIIRVSLVLRRALRSSS